MKSPINRYLLPGIVFQSVVVAGGYGSGRELVEFFLSIGVMPGLLAILTTMLIWSMVCVVTFEFSRLFKAYDYRIFFQKLLGPAWKLFEISYIGMMLVVLSIVVATAGSIIQEQFGYHFNLGVIAITSYICAMLYQGSPSIEKMLSFWTLMLYLVFGSVFWLTYRSYGLPLGKFSAHTVCDAKLTLLTALRYAGYNIGLIPAVLFTIRHLKSSQEAHIAGLLAGVIATIPGIFLFMALAIFPYDIHQSDVPILVLLNALNSPWLLGAYHVVMMMTLVETALGLIHAFNERIAVFRMEKNLTMSRRKRSLLGILILLLSTLLAQLGLKDLICCGYGILTWIIIAVYLIPLLTIGLYRILSDQPKKN